MNTCRVCGKTNYDYHRYDLVKYSVRHYAHPDCGLRKWGASFFDRLTQRQLTQFPYFAAKYTGFEKELRGRISSEVA